MLMLRGIAKSRAANHNPATTVTEGYFAPLRNKFRGTFTSCKK